MATPWDPSYTPPAGGNWVLTEHGYWIDPSTGEPAPNQDPSNPWLPNPGMTQGDVPNPSDAQQTPWYNPGASSPYPGAPDQQAPTTDPTAPPAAGGGGGGAPGGGGPNTPDIYNAPLTKMYPGAFTPPPMIDLGGPGGVSYLPKAPTLDFKPPTPEEAMNDPGYQFVRDQGTTALQNWAAAKGTLNDSSTAKSLTDYGQSAAGQQYAQVWGRNLAAAQAKLAPEEAAYQTTAAAGQHQNDLNYLNAWNKFLNDQNTFYNWQDRTWNKQYMGATA